jgi:ubiquinone/menaquinone biosynthesis C-methylase UbiE
MTASRFELTSLADDYFQRNVRKLDANQPASESTKFIAGHIGASSKLLEIGAANGRTLEQIRRMSGCNASGIDPSPLAIADGRSRYPDLRLNVASADALPFDDGQFDAVLIGFCLYLVDRADLFRIVMEADRVLANQGLLIITDFDPGLSCRTPFVHSEGRWSYKTDYAALWLANPQYVLVSKMSFSHASNGFHLDPHERVSTTILFKQSVDAAYPTKELS